jgi:hypothetical protein
VNNGIRGAAPQNFPEQRHSPAPGLFEIKQKADNGCHDRLPNQRAQPRVNICNNHKHCRLINLNSTAGGNFNSPLGCVNVDETRSHPHLAEVIVLQMEHFSKSREICSSAGTNGLDRRKVGINVEKQSFWRHR